MSVYNHRYPKYSRLNLLLHLTSSRSSRGSEVPGDYQVTSPFVALPSAWQRSIHRLWWGRDGNYFHPSSALHPCKCTDPLHWVDRTSLGIYFLVPPYLPMLEIIQMSQDPFPYPLQMRNGGSPLAHLSSSLDTTLDTSYWLRCNWLQPPPRAPEWWLDWALCNDWLLVCAICKYQQAAGLLPPSPLGGRPPSESQNHAEAAYWL
jgi:hypothetical protein